MHMFCYSFRNIIEKKDRFLVANMIIWFDVVSNRFDLLPNVNLGEPAFVRLNCNPNNKDTL